MPAFIVVPALFWVTLLLVCGGLALVRARDVLQRVVALDLLAVIVIALLALLSFVATVATARYLGSGGPFG